MNSHQSTSRITDVVPSNFLHDIPTMEKIAESLRVDETALSSSEARLSGLESRRRCLKEELASVERQISDVVEEQAGLNSSIADHKSLLAYSPVCALPAEVLSEIFLHYVSLSQPTGGHVYDQISASHYVHTPILLVCRRWRTTALADPRLWTTIPLTGSGYEYSERDHVLISSSPQERVAYWTALERRIERTAALPLHLLFHFSDEGYPFDPIDASVSLQTFFRLLPRANSISLGVLSTTQCLVEVLSLTDTDIPSADGVHTARVNVIDEEFGQKIMSVMPNVEVLEVVSLDMKQWFVDAPAAGHRLRSLHGLLDSLIISLEDLLDLLDHAPLLESLKVARVSVTPSTGTLRVVTHMLLSTFHFSATVADNDAVFGHLTLPALRSLSFEASRNGVTWPRPSSLAFFERSGCMLTDLSFRGCWINEREIREIFTAQKEIVTLQYSHFADDFGSGSALVESILEFFSTKPEGASHLHLPVLTDLRCFVYSHQLEALKRLIQVRSGDEAGERDITPLREVDIQVGSVHSGRVKHQEEKTAMFDEFANKGVKIRITFKTIFG